MVRLQNGVLESWNEGKELQWRRSEDARINIFRQYFLPIFSAIFWFTKKTLFLRVRILRPVLKLGRNYFHNLSMVKARVTEVTSSNLWCQDQSHMDSNCPGIFYSHVFRAIEQRGKSCTFIFRSFLNEINVLIYHNVFVLDLLACVVIFGNIIQKPIWSA